MEQGELPLFFLPWGVPFFVLSKLLERLLSERVSERSEKQLDVAAFSFSSKTVAVDMNKRGKYQKRSVPRDICKRCTGEEARQGRRAVDKTVRYPCSGAQCSSDEGQRTWPQNHFLPQDLIHAEGLRRSKNHHFEFQTCENESPEV